jgi:hypothetical protein
MKLLTSILDNGILADKYYNETEVCTMKEFFLDTEIEIIRFPESDIITSSGDPDELPPLIF